MTDFLEVHIISLEIHEQSVRNENRFIYLLQLILILMDRANGLFVAIVSFSFAFIVVLILPMYANSTSPQPPVEESQESDMISGSIESANMHVNDAMQAIQQNDSAEAMRSLEELQYDLSNINGNVTNLQFSVAAQPP
ncbi:MAG: hypothetical protein ACM3X1_02685 [Ignavibacteriales bacterium]